MKTGFMTLSALAIVATVMGCGTQTTSKVQDDECSRERQERIFDLQARVHNIQNSMDSAGCGPDEEDTPYCDDLRDLMADTLEKLHDAQERCD
ncbi:MAG: hypothetical protein AB7T49_10990 [Oligoflexales bacterium]